MKNEIILTTGIMIPNYIANNKNIKPIDKYIYSYILYFAKIQSQNKMFVEYYTSTYELAKNINVDNRTITASICRLKENGLITIKENKIKYGMTIHPLYNNKLIDMEKVRAEKEKTYLNKLEINKQQKKIKAKEREKDALDEFIEQMALKNRG